MTTETTETDRTVVAGPPASGVGQETVRSDSRRVTTTGPTGPWLIRRLVVLVFGLIQIIIGARVLLLLLDARESNAIVAGIISISQVFVAPFNGVLRTDSLASSGSVLDIAALVAFLGWTVLELIVLWIVGTFRHEAA